MYGVRGGATSFLNHFLGRLPMQLHAHIYYEHDQFDQADLLRTFLTENFPQGVVGRFHQQPVGPHTKAMFQVKFDQLEFANLLVLIRPYTLGQSILIHPDIEDQVLAHTAEAHWIGPALPLNIDALK